MKPHESGQVVAGRPVSVKRALVLMNPSADSCTPSEIRRAIAERLEPSGWSCDVVQVTSTDQLDMEAEESRRSGYEMVVVAGGNGTISRVARHLVGTEIPLGMIPVGRDNSLSLDLGIPADSDAAVDLLAGEHDIGYLDSMRVGGSNFFLQVGTTIAPAAANVVPAGGAQGGTAPATLGTKVRRALGFQSTRFTLLLDGRHYRTGAWQVVAINTGSVGSELLRSGPPIHPSDGAAELVVLQVRNILDLFRSGFGLRSRREEHAIDISYHRILDRAVIIPDVPMSVQGDGEPIGTTPLEVIVDPKAVRVILPKAALTLGTGVAVSPGSTKRHRRRAGWFRAALLHRLGPVGAVDTALFVAISQLPHPEPVNLLMQALEVGMASGRGWIAGVLAANLARRRPPWRDLVNLLPSLWIASLLTEYPIKEVFARPRPFASVVMTPVVGRKPSSHSFPSGHSASAFAGAWLLSRRYPRLSSFFYAFASLVAFSRVYQGVHYPSDVTIGAIAGTGLAAVYRLTLGSLVERALRRFIL